MSLPDPSTARAWLEESAWVQRLARRLVGEPAAAEDLAQEALLAAVTKPPAASVPFRGWLGGVVRNLARVARRGSTRRAAREAAHAPEESVEASDRIAERLEVQERIVAAVRGLDEPYRTTVALRYLEDLTTQEVAARLNVPVKTVHTRLERALAHLRERLDREHGSRTAWAGLLVPLSVPPPLPPAPLELAGPAVAVPLVAMGTATKWTAAAVTLAAVGFFAFQTLDHESPRASGSDKPPPEPPASALATPRTHPEDELAISAAREEQPAPAELPVAPQAPASAPAPRLLHGFVRDVEQRPVSGLDVFHEAIALLERKTEPPVLPPPARSDAGGRFELPVVEEATRLLAQGHGLATLYAPSVRDLPPEPPLVYVGPARDYGGQVVTEDGTPLAEVEFELTLAPDLARALAPGAFAGSIALASAWSDTLGHFQFPTVGFAPGSRIRARKDGFESATLTLPEASSADLIVTLRALERGEHVLAGTVALPDGRPAPLAWVASSGERGAVRCDDRGHFEIPLAEGEDPLRLRAILPGHQPGELELAGLDQEARHELYLVLGPPGRTIQGRVLDREGRPLAGVRVWTEDGQPFGEIATRVGQVEFMLTYDHEGVIAGPNVEQKDGRKTKSSDDGAFELSALCDTDYTLYAQHSLTREVAGPFTVRAGASGVELVVTGTETARRVAGRVTNFAGAPLANVLVRAHRTLGGAGRELRVYADVDEGVRSDAQGRFEFESLCVEGTRLVAIPPDGQNESTLVLEAEQDLEDLHFALAGVCHLRVTLDDPARASSLMLQDERGENVSVSFHLGGMTCMADAVQITDGKSELLTADDSAVMLVLVRGPDESEREHIPIRLAPGEVNEIRP